MLRHTLDTITAPGFPERSPEIVRELVANVRSQPTHPAAFMAQLFAVLADDRSERVRAITAPTLVVHGAQDKLIHPTNGRRLAERIPGARLVMLDDCGHMPMHEKPDELVAIVLDFLA